MPNLKSILLCAAMACSSAATAQDQTGGTETPPASDVTADTVLATVGGTEITVGHVIALTFSLPQEQQQLPDQVLFDGVLERLIQQEAISQSVGDPGALVRLQVDNERRALIANAKVNEMANDIEVTPEAVQAAYQAHIADFTPTMEFNASHILVETEEEAQALVEELEDGADFAELAKLHSTGPSGPGGGELGWFERGRMVEPFQAAVDTLEAGEISGPVQTQFGWHVVKLNETRIPEVPTLEQMRDSLTREVWQNKLRERIGELLEGIETTRTDASGIDPNVVRNRSLIGG